MTHILYLAHDLSDPAIRRRVLTLLAGGAQVTLAGFRRGRNQLAEIEGVVPVVLGETADGQFLQRMAAVAKASLSLGKLLSGIPTPDIILARNLEMLALAKRAMSIFGGQPALVYECLDIHRLLLNEGRPGQLLNAAQRYFARDAKLLVTSSPAFVEHYFKPVSGLDLPVLLQENKVLALDSTVAAAPQPHPPKPGEPWKIGWFGALRCRRSLEILAEFARRMEGRVEIILRGRPAYSEFTNFDGFVAAAPHLHFHGPYKNPEDLAAIYNEVQFTWAIDFFEEGQNSSWLLPNRLYEGGLYGTLPIALSGTETARFIEKRDIGFVLANASPDDLAALFGQMTPQTYANAFDTLSAIDRKQWLTDRDDCRRLVQHLSSLTTSASGHAREAQFSTV
ncbi:MULTISPECIES: glycosyl transferase family 1 [Agrobacterium]|uniref:glycosyl transferase family 1 n=1 Tax=Agrobacterium TaxID=357 RepID=UPI00174B72B9|nr:MULTISPECIES: glycosyl transferase family 1 [Agrobacterium]MDA5638764.1 glycosyl transferase family 1 [Agrobacterium sp. ST15.13.013]MDA6998400.1 glycosyl transferase family 1 [Agrobacterium salinitolerans]